MAGDSHEQQEVKFAFQLLSGKQFNSICNKESTSSLEKWGMQGRLHAQTYSFDQQYKPYDSEKFALDFFQDASVLHSLQTVSSNGSLSAIGTKASRVALESVPSTCVSMTLFDKLEKEGIVRDNGSIRKCLEEYVDGVCIPDELRQVLLNEEYEKYDIFSQSERSEFLFRLFTHICIGGGICQYEDDVAPYVTFTKQLYKELISVQKEPHTNDLHVISNVYAVKSYDDTFLYYPDDKEHINSFSYLIIDPLKRHVTVLYHKYGGGLF